METKVYRNELKFLCTEQDLCLIENKIRHICRPDTHAGAEGTYSIKSLYFDTYDDRCLYENQAGVDNRKKYRIRIYNDDPSIIKLECKHSSHGKKAKESCNITRQQCEALMGGTMPGTFPHALRGTCQGNGDGRGIEEACGFPRAFRGICQSLGNGAGREALLDRFCLERMTGMLMPKVIVEYTRTPYIFAAGNVRITFDRAIRSSYRTERFLAPNATYRTILPALTLLYGRIVETPETAKASAKSGDAALSKEPEDGTADLPSEGVYIRYAVNSKTAGQISGETLQNVQGQETTRVTAVPSLGYRFVGWSDGKEDPVRQGDAADESRVITAVFDYDQLEMPILSIVTSTGKDVESKTESIDATLTLLGAAKKYNFDQMEIKLKGRGNFTWDMEKKSYKMKLPQKQSLLGLGKGKSKKWVLLANHCDQSLLRNYVSLHLAGEMPSIAWSPDCTSVEVYLNGEYRGVYLLTEEVEAGKNKVAVSEEVTGMGADIGYLIEMTSNGKNVVFDAGNKTYQLHSDLSKDKDEARDQYAYIREYVQKCWDALNEGEEEAVGQLIDLDSMVDAYLAEEILKNMDVGWDSFYLHKNVGGKLIFGPLWDFDLALGNANMGVESFDLLYAAYMGEAQSNPWFYTAMYYPWFRQRVVERWDEIAPIREGLSAMAVETAEESVESFQRNFKKWKIFGQSLNRETRQITSLSTYGQHYRFLAQWIDRRLEWLDDCYHDENFLTQWTGFAPNPNEGKPASECGGNEDAKALFEGYARCAVIAGSVDATAHGFGGEGVVNLFDDDVSTKYCANIDKKVEITFSLSEKAVLSGYVFCTANDTASYPERNPVKWVLYGKASDGKWNKLDACDSETMGLEADNYYCHGRFCTDGTAYKEFKLIVSHNGALQLGEIALFGEETR